MKSLVILSLVLWSLSAQGTQAHQWLKIFQQVLIETLPVHRVYIIEEHRVFSFEVPTELINFEDTTILCDMARSLGYSARPFWNTRKMPGDFAISNRAGTKLLQSNWYWSFCGHSILATELPMDFCSQKETSSPENFKNKQFWDKITRNNAWSRSLIDLPFLSNPWVKIPHFEYRQCFRFSQSLFAVLLKIREQYQERYLHVDITTVIPTPTDFTHHYFEYWATDYAPIDLLRLKRLMHSIQVYENMDRFKIYGDLLIDMENIKVEHGFIRSPEQVLEIVKKIVRIR